MRAFPKNRAGRLRLACLVLVLAWAGASARVDRQVGYLLADKREGDILFQSLPHGELVDAIEGVSRSPWSHCGLLVRRDGGWYVAEALGHVRHTPLYLWLPRGRESRVEAYRLKDRPADTPARLEKPLTQLEGRPYDFHYAPGDDEVYCSELVFLAYQRGLGIELARWEALRDLDWKPHEHFIRSMEDGQLPLDRPMVTPVALTRSELLHRVFP